MEVLIEKKSFAGGLNSDDSLTSLGEGEYFNALNFRGFTSEKGRISGLQPLPGSTELFNLLPAGTNYCMGGCEDEARRRVVWFNWNSAGVHGVYVYDLTEAAGHQVCMSPQVTGGLNFDQFHYIHSCFVLNGCVYWTDNLNPPRRLNIDAGIQMNLGALIPSSYVPNTSYLPVNSIDPNNGTFKDPSFLVSTFQIPTAPLPSYASGLISYKFYYSGSDGNTPAPIEVFMNWSEYPGKSAAQVFADGIVGALTALGTATVDWDIYATETTLTIYIKNTWDFGTGDSHFAPTVRLNILVNNYLNADGSTPNPYVAPLSQAVISWARRPPALPPIQQKMLESPVPSSNFIGDQAFQFCWRLQFREYELSTLSPLSDTADMNEPDPPPTETSLGVTNNPQLLRGYLATEFVLPTDPSVYGSNVYAKITRVGTLGPNAVATDIPIPLNWAGFPATRGYQRVIVEGINDYFKARPGSDNPGALTTDTLPKTIGNTNAKWYISTWDNVNPVLNILETWDWGIGDTQFPPTTQAYLTLYSSANAVSKQYSLIKVTLPLAEAIDQDVIQIDLVTAYLLSGVYFIIKSWNVSRPADLLAMANHNSGVAPLSYNFRNNQVGIALDSAYSVKPFDSIPYLVQTIDRAKNSAFMGGYVLGYNSAGLPTSLSVTPVMTTIGSSPAGDIIGEWWRIQFFNVARTTVYAEYIVITTVPVTGEPAGSPQYYYTVNGAALPLPLSINTGLLFLGTTLQQVMDYYLQKNSDSTPGILGSLIDTDTAVSLLPTVPNTNFGIKAKCLKSNAFYQACVTFYDDYQRHTGIITDDSCQISTPNTAFSQNLFMTALNWTLSNSNAINEIPAEAKYYSVGLTKCLKMRFFVGAIGFVTYCSIDDEGVLSFTTLAYDYSLHGVAIDITQLVANGMGYVFSQGDICNFYLGGTYYSVGVIGVSGNYLILALTNVGTVGGVSHAQFEIYTPYKQQTNEPYYEQGQIIPILNPGTASRAYALTQGSLAGDTYIFQRINLGWTYWAEAMSPNNAYYLQWITNAGRPNFTDAIGRVNQTMSVAFSDPFIEGSQINGLSTFEALNTQALSQEFGPLQRLFLTSKIEMEGSVMLAICVMETVSLYLQETQVAAPQGNAFLATSTSLIGTIYPLKGSLGTMNPESVVGLHGDAFWIDLNNFGPVQYSDNGLELLTKFKRRTFWRAFCLAYKALTPQQIMALGNQPGIIGGVDTFNGEIIWTLPQVLASNPSGSLPGGIDGAPPNLFNDFDGMARTVVYKREINKWMPSIQVSADAFVALGGNVYGFKNGALYLMNDITATVGKVLGSPLVPMVMFAPTAYVDTPKRYNSVSVESDEQPDTCFVMSDYPNLQITDLVGADWNDKEGVFSAALLRDRLSPAYPGNFNLALNFGDHILGKSPQFQLNFLTGVFFNLKYVNIGYTLSRGIRTIASK